MNRSNLILTLAAALLLAPITSMFAQSTWQTADNLAPAAGRDIVADNRGNFISLALDYTTTNAITAVNRSSDGGATWETVGSIAGYALDVAAAPDGALFATGNRSTTVSGRAFVWQSLDHGATWAVFDPSAGLLQPMLAADVAAGNSGAVYVCGQASGNWLVRKGQRTQDGIMWTTSDSIGSSSSSSVCVRPASPGDPDEVLVCGVANGRWTVRRTTDGGSSWMTADSYSVGIQSGYSGVTTGPGNSIYVVGRIGTTVYTTNQSIVKKKAVVTVTSTTEYGWLVRKSGDGGATWANVDYVANGWPGNGNIVADSFGRVFVVGFNSMTPYAWLVRGSADGGATWVTTDLFPPADTTQSQAWGVASDMLGNVCVVGELTAGTSKTAVIRRLAAP